MAHMAQLPVAPAFRSPATSGALDKPSPYRWLALILGVLAFATASILTRLADAPPLVVGAWRMILATALLTPWALPKFLREAKALQPQDVLALVLAATALALHFATWITSLALTTVASSVILVTTNPIFVALATHFVLKERVSGRQVVAVALALMGSIVVGHGDFRLSGEALLGDLLALLGAVMASAYFMLGRAVRRKMSTLAYVWPCYGVAALWLVGFCLVGRQPLGGHRPQAYLIFLLLALGPQVLGHSSFNWALGQFSPLMVTLAILGEPVGATVLAILVLSELPPLSAPLGGLLIVAGIYLASRDELHPHNLDHQQGEP